MSDFIFFNYSKIKFEIIYLQAPISSKVPSPPHVDQDGFTLIGKKGRPSKEVIFNDKVVFLIDIYYLMQNN